MEEVFSQPQVTPVSNPQPEGISLGITPKVSSLVSRSIDKRGVLKSFNPQAYVADVQLVDSSNVILRNVPVAKNINPASLLVGQPVVYSLFDENNPLDGCVTSTYAGTADTLVHYFGAADTAGGTPYISTNNRDHPKRITISTPASEPTYGGIFLGHYNRDTNAHAYTDNIWLYGNRIQAKPQNVMNANNSTRMMLLATIANLEGTGTADWSTTSGSFITIPGATWQYSSGPAVEMMMMWTSCLAQHNAGGASSQITLFHGGNELKPHMYTDSTSSSLNDWKNLGRIYRGDIGANNTITVDIRARSGGTVLVSNTNSDHRPRVHILGFQRADAM